MQTREEVIAELKRILPEVQEDDERILLKVKYSTGYGYAAILYKQTGDVYYDSYYDRDILNIFDACSEEIKAINAIEQGSKKKWPNSYSVNLKEGKKVLIGKPTSKNVVANKLIEEAEDQGFHVHTIDSLIYIYTSVDDTHDLGVTANIETGEVNLAGSPDTDFSPKHLPTETLNMYLAEFQLKIHRINDRIAYNERSLNGKRLDPEENKK